MRLTGAEISRLLPPKLLGTSWEAVQQFARAVEAATAERCALLCDERDAAAYARWRKDCNPYDDGQCDMAREIGIVIRDAYKEPTNG